MPRLGAHLSIAGGLPRAVDRAVATRCEAFQIFTKSTGQWRARPLPSDEIVIFRRRVAETGIEPGVGHTSYLINLAAAAPALRSQSEAALLEEYDRADALGLAGLVLHPGAFTSGTEAEGLRLIAAGLRRVLRARRRATPLLLLEHTAGQGTALGHRFEHLATILEYLDGSPRVGVCLDTCHLLAAGYDIVSDAGYADTINTFDRVVGVDRVKAVHLNDSAKPIGSRVDRHAHIGQGHLGLQPFRRLLHDPRLSHLPMIIETPKVEGSASRLGDADPHDLRNLRVLRRLHTHA
jgi:deoxyribonuclease IV